MENYRQNIYPLNEINFKALLNYYFPKHTSFDTSRILDILIKHKITLKILEETSEKIQDFIPLIESKSINNPTQEKLAIYSLELFCSEVWYLISNIEDKGEKGSILAHVREKAGLPHKMVDKIYLPESLKPKNILPKAIPDSEQIFEDNDSPKPKKYRGTCPACHESLPCPCNWTLEGNYSEL